MADNLNALVGGMPVGAGRYVLLQQLGKGGMGVVWLALDERLDEQVALKFLPPEIQMDPSMLDDMRRETARSRKLAHPNIIRIHDLHEFKDEAPFISMEFVDGQTLSYLKTQKTNRTFPWEELKPMVQQLCEALEYAHSERIIHRDLKPGNMMMDNSGRLKLADFGIAAVVGDSLSRVSLQGNTSGTPAYMSPQQMDGRTPRVTDDIYALGALLYEMLSGKPPFFRGDVIHQVRNIAAEPLDERLLEFNVENPVPSDVVAMIMACLSKEPDQRPQSARTVAEWIGLATGESIEPKTLSSQLFGAQSAEFSSSTNPIPSTSKDPDLAESEREDVEDFASETDAQTNVHPNRRQWIAGGLVSLSLAGGVAFLFRRNRQGGRRNNNMATELPPHGRDSPELTELGAGVVRIFGKNDLYGCTVLTTKMFEDQPSRFRESKGWWQADDPNWQIKDGIITGSVTAEPGGETRSYLILENLPLSDFELGFAFRESSDSAGTGNSGLFYRCKVAQVDQRPGQPAVAGPAVILGSPRGGLHGVPENRRRELSRPARPGNRLLIGKSPGMRELVMRLRSTDVFGRDGGSYCIIKVSDASIRHIVPPAGGHEFELDPGTLPERGLIALEIWASDSGTRTVEFESLLLHRSPRE